MKPLELLYRNPWREHALCLVFKAGRMRLPSIALNAWFPGADEARVWLTALPQGPWSTPTVDVVFLAKLIRLLEPTRALELGSYRGYVARVVAEHMPSHGRLVTVDIDPGHGEAYAGTELAGRIDRRTGAIAPDLFDESEKGTYDFIFVDADHAYDSVKHDTEVALPLLGPQGVMVWHDYANWGAFDRKNGVPEYLGELADVLPIAHLAGSNMAVHCHAWRAEQRADFDAMVAKTQQWSNEEHWRSSIPPPA